MTIHRVLKAAKDHGLNPSHKSNRSILSPQLDQELLWSIPECERRNIPIVTGVTIWEKADAIREKLIVEKCHGLSSNITHGEASSVKIATLEKGQCDLRRITNSYARRDIFNMDEMAYYYYTTPSGSISAAGFSGRKTIKKRMTIAVACNADGSLELPLLFVGASRQPWCFLRESTSELGFDYSRNPKG
uniref:DNA binding protein putative n=1 Tax=Albugo laibachii Nc14 TaxID=890382 RepID=F0W6X1_9STRA|nr:DNA binding protein putative [Albugo laibachii Nc14]|eukprot:CCA16866.1 DNA binding protein putative [Albugo laibachii Nc14]